MTNLFGAHRSTQDNASEMQDNVRQLRHIAGLTSQHSKPILILTLRRTGGTSLARVLYSANDCAVVEDEAFNVDRTFGAITRAYDISKDLHALRASVREALSTRVNLKHAIDTVPLELTRILVEEASAASYCLILLLRRDERARLRSLAIAQATGVWGPEDEKKVLSKMEKSPESVPAIDLAKARQHIFAARTALGALMQALNAISARYVGVFFEDLYHDPSDDHLHEIFSQVGFGREDVPAIRRALFARGGQNSGTIARMLTNMGELDALYESLCV